MKTPLYVYVAALVVVFAIVGGYYYPASTNTTVVQTAGTSPQGSTGATARQYNVYGVNLAAPGANATSTSYLNQTGQDIYVSAVKIGCEGVGTSLTAYSGAGLANLQVSVGTTSTAAPGSLNSFAQLMKGFNLGTGTPNLLIASSSLTTATSSNATVWHNGEYMTFFFNATNTAVCTVGVDGFTS